MKTIMRNAMIVLYLLLGSTGLADDPISNLTQRLNSEVGGLWMNGAQPSFTLPATSSASQVVAAAAQAWRVTKGTNDTLRILDIREVRVNGPQQQGSQGAPWKAAWIECSAGRKVLLFRAEGENHWWTRFFDVTNAEILPHQPERITGLPAPENVFAIAIEPHAKELKDYFTPASLLETLPRLVPADVQMPAGGKIFWQSGVIALTNKSVLFWRTCGDWFIAVDTPTGPTYYALENTTSSQQKADVSAIVWGQEIDGLQVGLVPIGRGTDGSLAWRDECPDCDSAGKPERRLWSGACDICGAKTVQGAHCESCRANLRLCYACKKVRPAGSHFNVGDALAFEVHIRNTGKKDMEVAEVDSAYWGLFFRPKKETLGAEDGWEAEFKQLNRKASPGPMLIPPGGHPIRFWMVGSGGEAASFVSLRRKDADVVANLPAGDYAATVVLRRGTGNEARHVTSGPVTVQISDVTHTVETKEPD